MPIARSGSSELMHLSRLLGTWRLVECNEPSFKGELGTSVTFEEEGRMTYTFHQKERDQIVPLTYKLLGPLLVTNQPSDPREEWTRFRFDEAGQLVLEFEKTTAVFQKQSGSAA